MLWQKILAWLEAHQDRSTASTCSPVCVRMPPRSPPNWWPHCWHCLQGR